MSGENEFARLEAENAQLSEQVKRLVRVESQLQGAREDMEAQCRLYRQLYEAGRKLNGTLDPREIVAEATRFVLYDANFQLCAVLLAADDGFRVAGSDGYYDDDQLLKLSSLSVFSTHPILARLTGGAAHLLCPPGCDDAELRRFGQCLEMDEYVLFPLHGPGIPLGLLAAGNRSESAEFYTRVREESQFVVLLASFVAQVSAALSNIRLYSELQRERDLLEVRVAERTKQLHESEERLRVIVENTMDVIYAVDTAGRITYASPSVRTWGYTPEELVGKDGFALIHPEDRHATIAKFQATVTTGDVSASYFRVLARDGTAVPVERHGRPLVRDGQVVGLVAVIRDISLRLKMETALRESEERYRTLVSDLPIGVFRSTAGPNGRFLEANPAMVMMYGYDSAEEFARTAPADLYQDPAHRKLFVDRVAAAGFVRGHQLAMRRKDGTPFWASCTATAHWNPAGELEWLDGVVEDITERKRMEEELRDSQRRLSDILQFLPDATLVVDTRGRAQVWNQAMEKITGVPASKILGKDDYEYAIAFYGERRPILIDKVLHPEEVPLRGYSEVRQEGDVWFAEGYAPRLQTGGWFRASATALRDREGRVVGAIEAFRDITERKRTNDALARARDAAETANRAKSAFLAMMSHEIRTPMNAVIGLSGLLIDSGGLNPQQSEYAAGIRNAGESLLVIINDILDFSKIEAGRLELENRPFDLRLCVESVLELLGSRARDKGLELGCLIEAHTPSSVLGDPVRLNQILINLVGNAIKFTNSGEVVVNVEAQRLNGAEAEGRFELHFAVRDTGIGIPPDRMDRLFQPFSQADSSTSRRYGGTGLGLAISKRLAEMMGGRVWVESVVDQGSTFHFTIVAPAAAAVTPVYLSGDQPALRGKRVLIVDDNPTNLQILAGQTQCWGMLPKTVNSGQQALICLCQGEQFDLLVTDLHMPGMDGIQLSETIRLVPGGAALPLVLLSSSGCALAPSEAGRFRLVLVKPVKASRLYNSLLSIFGTVAAAEGEGLTPAASPADSAMAAKHPLRILLAEDNATNQMLAQGMLQRLGYRADLAGNGREAVAALERQSYDVVLMDLQMPEMDGLEATREIRRRLPPVRQPRIIAMTADAMTEDRAACFDAGMDDYLSKPVRMDSLIAALDKSAPPQHAAAEVAPIDQTALDRLRDTVGGEPAALPALLQSFERDGVQMLDLCRRALGERNAPELRRGAHSLKSNAAIFGAVALSAAARELELQAKDGCFDGAHEQIERMARLFDRAHMELSAMPLFRQG